MTAAENHLIELLSLKVRKRLLAVSELVPLVIKQVLCEPGTVTRYVYFPVDGFISLVAPLGGTPSLEVGMAGREGMLGVEVALGVLNSPLHALVQGPGTARRIGARAFRAELRQSLDLRRVMHRYIYVLMGQLGSSAACLRFHLIGQRLARWLLMSQDRAQSDQFHVTHEFLAYMLGVRRVGITAAAGVLQRNGLIEYQHGELKVLDRAGLEHAACACYAEQRLAYATLL